MKDVVLSAVSDGEIFELDGVEFMKLDENENGVFVIANDILEDNVPFSKYIDGRYAKLDDSNFIGSYIQCLVDDLVTEHPKIAEAVLGRYIDLTSITGKGGYDQALVCGRILTIDEYIKYRKLIPKYPNKYWLATPGSGINPTNLVVDTTGVTSLDKPWNNDACCVPTLYLNPLVRVYVAREEEKAGLGGYTDAELLEELLSRERSIARTLYKGGEHK